MATITWISNYMCRAAYIFIESHMQSQVVHP